MLSFSWEPGGGTISFMLSVMIFASHISVSKESCALENLPIENQQDAASSSSRISSKGYSKVVEEATANPKKPSLACDSVMTLLDMYAGMSTGLYMGAAGSDADLTFADYMFEIDTFQTMHGLDGRQVSYTFLLFQLFYYFFSLSLLGRKFLCFLKCDFFFSLS
ncbi:hypothetical protein MKW92_053884 [Papaver armeniacum]|nr:hypothetical protein MKW92_053884 [Papaver armeniacum]